MINLKVGICYNLLLNTTKIDWTVLQYEFEKIVKNAVLHCLSRKFEKISTIKINDEIVSIYMKYNQENRNVEFICINADESQLDIL